MPLTVDKLYDEIQEHKTGCMNELGKKYVTWFWTVTFTIGMFSTCVGLTLAVHEKINNNKEQIIQRVDERTKEFESRTKELEKRITDQDNMLREINKNIVLILNEVKNTNVRK